MIKKLFIVLIVALLAWGGWTYFVKGREVCTVTLESGEVKEQKARDIREIYEKDAYNWNSYSGSKVTVTGKITKIEQGMAPFRIKPDYNVYFFTVTIGRGIKLLVIRDQLGDRAVGDKVTVSGELTDGVDTDYLYITALDPDNQPLAEDCITPVPAS